MFILTWCGDATLVPYPHATLAPANQTNIDAGQIGNLAPLLKFTSFLADLEIVEFMALDGAGVSTYHAIVLQ